MSAFEEVQYVNSGAPVALHDSGNAEKGRASDLTGESIPVRYRDGRGGINLEQVRREQLRARQEWLRAVVQRMKALWGR
jgi:hypothetical protein